MMVVGVDGWKFLTTESDLERRVLQAMFKEADKAMLELQKRQAILIGNEIAKRLK